MMSNVVLPEIIGAIMGRTQKHILPVQPFCSRLLSARPTLNPIPVIVSKQLLSLGARRPTGSSQGIRPVIPVGYMRPRRWASGFGAFE